MRVRIGFGVALRQILDRAQRSRRLSPNGPGSGVVDLPVFYGGTGPAPGVDLLSNRAMAEFLDDGMPLEKRR